MTDKNKALFTTLHADYHGMVTQLCMGFMKGDSDLAKDLSQEVFINTWNALPKFRGASSYKTWIYRTTVNTCLKFIRDRKDKNRATIEEIENTAQTSSGNDGTYNSLYSAIGRLEEVDRLIMMMVLDELSYEEISSIMGISEPSLRVKIHRIKKKLKTILEHER